MPLNRKENRSVGEAAEIERAVRVLPQVLAVKDYVLAKGLLQPGVQIRYEIRMKLPPGSSASRFRSALNAAFPDAGWQVRDSSNAAPGVDRFIDRTAQFLTLVGLTALLIGVNARYKTHAGIRLTGLTDRPW